MSRRGPKPPDPHEISDAGLVVDSQGRRPPRALRYMLGPTEFIKTGLSLFDPHDPYYFAVSLSWSRFFLLFVASEGIINTLFALLYLARPGAIANQQIPGFAGAFFFSLETLATVGYGEMYPGTVYGHVVSSIEIMVGVIFMAIMTGLLFVRFSKPKPKFVYAAHPVVTTYNGKPTLMLRIGNARLNPMHDAHAHLYTIVRSTSEEGHAHANIVSLPLVRDRLPVFAILWTIMHVIDEDSPFLPLLDAPDVLNETRFFLMLSARDPLIGQEVSDLRAIFGSEIQLGMRYTDIISNEANNRVVADYARISAIEVDGARLMTSAGSGGGIA